MCYDTQELRKKLRSLRDQGDHNLQEAYKILDLIEARTAKLDELEAVITGADHRYQVKVFKILNPGE